MSGYTYGQVQVVSIIQIIKDLFDKAQFSTNEDM